MSTSLDDLKWMKYSQREVDFILYNWRLVYDEVIYPNDLNYLKNLHIFCLDNDIVMPSNLFPRVKIPVVNYELISWFKDDLRSGLFLYTFIHFKHNHLELIARFYNNFLKDLVISIDCVSENNNLANSKFFNTIYKTFAIKDAFNLYKRYRTKSKDLSWLNCNSREQLDWAMEYLQRLGLLIQPYNFLPANNKESYIQICASIDALDLHPNSTTAIEVDNLPNQSFNNLDPFHTGYENSEYKEKILSNIRNAWNQKVFRDKKPVKIEKQIKLPYGYSKKLDKIAEAYGENSVESLKKILDKEYNDVVLLK